MLENVQLPSKGSTGISFPRLKTLQFRVKGEGTCKQGERADLTGCSPATHEGGGGTEGKPEKPASKKPTSAKPENISPSSSPQDYAQSLYSKETKDSKKLRKEIDKELSGIDVAPYEQRIQSILKQGQVAVRVTAEKLASILRDGRLKTIHEGVESSGWKAPTKRKQAEEGTFGLPKDAPPADRPIYGYVTSSGGQELSLPATPEGHDYSKPHDQYGSYGDVAIVLKSSVKDRSSVTYGDSLNNRGMAIPSSMSDPKIGSIRYGWYHKPDEAGIDQTVSKMEERAKQNGTPGFESQIWGGVKVEDIEQITSKAPLPKELVAGLEELGIKVQIAERKAPKVPPSPFEQKNVQLPSANLIRNFAFADLIRTKAISGEEYAAQLEAEYHLQQQQKAMSYLDNSRGGALVPPPEHPLKAIRKKYRKGKGFDLVAAERLDPAITRSAQECGKWLAEKWAQLENRYGRKTALAMAVASLVTFPIPFNITAIIAIAETIRGVSGKSLDGISFPSIKLKSVLT